MIWSKCFGAGGFCRAVAVSGVCAGAIACPPCTKACEGCGASQCRWEGTEDRERWQTGLQTPSLHPSNAAGVWGAARPDGVQSSLLQPKPSPAERCGRTGGQLRGITPNTHHSEMASANTADIPSPWGQPFLQKLYHPREWQHWGVLPVSTHPTPPSLLQRLSVQGMCIYTVWRCLSLFAHTCTQQAKQSHRYSRTQGTRVCTPSPYASMAAGLPARGCGWVAAPGQTGQGGDRHPVTVSSPRGLCFAVYPAFPGSQPPSAPWPCRDSPRAGAESLSLRRRPKAVQSNAAGSAGYSHLPATPGPGHCWPPSPGRGCLQLAKESCPGYKTPGEDTAPSFKCPASVGLCSPPPPALLVPTSL